MPGGKHENMKAWTTEEDHIIIDGVHLHGHQWRMIVQELSGRSVSSTRNRFNRIEKGRKMRESGTRGRNMCHACWQPKKGHICTAKLDGGPHVIQQMAVDDRSVQPMGGYGVAQQGAVPRVATPSETAPPPASAPAVVWAKPVVARSSSMLSVLSGMLGGSDDIGAIFGEWAKADAAEVGAAPPLLPTLSPSLPPSLPPSLSPSLPDEQQLEAVAPPALLRMASGEVPMGWKPPKLTRSLSSFFKCISSDLLQNNLAPSNGGDARGDARSDGRSDGRGPLTAEDELSIASNWSDMSSSTLNADNL